MRPVNEMLTNKSMQIKFLRNFLEVYISQIIFIGFILALTLMDNVANFILYHVWICWIGVCFYLLLFVPVIFGFTRFYRNALQLIVGINISLIMIVTQITVSLENPIGYICFLSVVVMLCSLYAYTWIITENYNFIIAYCVSSLAQTVYLGILYYVFFDDLEVFICYFFYNLGNGLVITYACHLHLTDWMQGGEYNENDFLHPGIRLHYDYIMIVLKKINDYKTKEY
jgi:hypothetical protein